MRRCELWLLFLLGCGPANGPGDTGELEDFACELGARDADGAFVPYEDSGQAELVLGFQGLLMVVAYVRADDPPANPWAVGSITPDAEDPSGTNQPLLPFDDTGLSEDLVLYLPSNVPSAYQGRAAELAVRVESKRARCVATASVILVDENPCVGTGFDCADTGL